MRGNVRRQLTGQPLNPELQVQYQLSLGAGFRRFGHNAQAREALQEGIRLAEHYGYNVELFRLERELAALDRGEATERLRTIEPPASVAEVATAMRELKEAALAGT